MITPSCRDDNHLACPHTEQAPCACGCHTPGTLDWHRRCAQYAYRARAACSPRSVTRRYWSRSIREHEQAIAHLEQAQR